MTQARTPDPRAEPLASSQVPAWVDIGPPSSLLAVVQQLRGLIAEGVLVEAGGTCRLEDIREEKPWPDDLLTIHLVEGATGRRYVLSCDTYHGGGVFKREDLRERPIG